MILGSAAAACFGTLRYMTWFSTSLEVERIPGAIVYFDSSLRVVLVLVRGCVWDAFGSFEFSILNPVSVIR